MGIRGDGADHFCVSLAPQWRKRSGEDGKHQAHPEVPVGHEPALPGGVVHRRDVTRGGGAAGEQVIIPSLSQGSLFNMVTVLTVSWLTTPVPLLQSHHGGLWKRQDRLQQQLQPLWEVCPAALQPEGEHPGRQDRRLYPLKPHSGVEVAAAAFKLHVSDPLGFIL